MSSATPSHSGQGNLLEGTSSKPPSPRSSLRYVLPVLGVLALIGALAAVKVSQIRVLTTFGAAMKKQGPPPESVGSATASVDVWQTTLSAVGSVEAGKGVTLTNDAPGVVTAIHFESGTRVKKGDVLVELDTSVERAQLASTIARRDFALVNVKRSRSAVSEGVLPVAQLDSDEAQVKSLSADAAGLAAQIARKVVRAPFDGTLGIRTVNIGQYLNPGTALSVLQSIGEQFVDFSLPQQRLADLKLGMNVRFSAGGPKDDVFDGNVAAIDPSVDVTTRAIKLRATVKDPDKKLRPGMFVNVSIQVGEKRRVVAVPSTALVHASYGDSVFVIEDKADAEGKQGKAARQQFVRTGETRGDFVAIEDGLKGGETVVAAGAFKLRNGMKVTINNDVGAKPDLAPHPENR